MPQTTNERILERYNHAVDSVIDAYKLGSNFQLNDSMNKIDIAATSVYQSLEWFFKKYLIDKYPDKTTSLDKYQIIEGYNFHHKVDLFEKVATPAIIKGQFNLDAIKSLKQSVRNNPEHSGIVPHFDSLKIVISETYKLLKIYLTPSQELRQIPENVQINIPPLDNWNDFFSIMDNFEKEKIYILVSDTKFRPYKEVLRPFGLIDWNFIFDFDDQSVNDGLFKYASPEIKNSRVVHQVVLKDPIANFSYYAATYWVFSNGIDGRSGTTFSSYKEWNKNYSSYLDKVISKIQKSISDKPVTVVFAIESYNHIAEMSRLFYNHLGSSVKFVFVDISAISSGEVAIEYGGNQVEISIPQISNGILQFKSYFNPSIQSELISIAHKDNGYVEISKDDLMWIEEDFELIHRNILDNIVSNYDFKNRAEFYRGSEINWGGLHFNFDIKRDSYVELRNKIDRKIRERISDKFYIFHYPGIGGTTISKRLAWDLHRMLPVIILKKYRSIDTINRVFRLFQLTSLPPVIIIDGSKIDEAEFDLFFSELLQRNFPSLFLLVQRHTSPRQVASKESIYFSEVLTDNELGSFVSVFSDLSPEKRSDLQNVLRTSEKKKRHPFYLGLIAFEKQFDSLSSFVKKAIHGSSGIQKKILAYISFCDIYAQRPISAQLFTGLLMLPETTVIRLEKILTQSQIYLLVNEKSIEWRTLHYLISRQILMELFGDGYNEVLMKNSLDSLSIEFIENLAIKSFDLSQEDLDILNLLFISRSYDQETEGSEETHFSKLISEGISDDTARLRVFEKLTEVFPEYPHFWSHLARFYNFRIRDSEKALDAIDKAISLEEQLDNSDSTLYHIRGMILRSKLRRLSNKFVNGGLDKKETSEEIRVLYEQAALSFDNARELNPKDDYGYISDIELIISYLDFKFMISGVNERSIFLSRLNSFDMQVLEKAQELLEDIKSMKIGHEEGFYVKRCSGQILEYYTDYNTIIQNWNSLLDATKNYPKESVRRQLVRAYVSRARGWENLAAKDFTRILQLIEDNISENSNSTQNIYLWFQTARQTDTITLNEAIEKVARWRLLKQTVVSNYYLTCLHVLQAIGGETLSKVRADQLLRETSEMSRGNTNRAYCQDWFGKGGNLQKLTSSKQGISRDDNYDMIFNSEVLEKVKARITEIKGPEAGSLELESGLKAFFVPARAFKGEGAVRDRHLNEAVEFYLGFSYDGLRGFDVTLIKL